MAELSTYTRGTARQRYAKAARAFAAADPRDRLNG